MEKEHIIAEIRRTAEENNGKPLGAARLEKETGIKKSDWDKHWARLGDAQREAGYPPNALRGAYDESYLVKALVSLIQKLGRYPSSADISLESHKNKGFPTYMTFRGRGEKPVLARKVIEYCNEHSGLSSVIDICRPVAETGSVGSVTENVGTKETFGFVYLVKSGKYYKIGKTDSVERRTYELKIQLPEKTKRVHHIKTDDPAGIEAYWHKRFKDRHKNGEWFELSAEDVKAFKRRKFM